VIPLLGDIFSLLGKCQKHHLWKGAEYFGKHGFIMHGAKIEINPINLSYLQTNAEKLLADKK
jgi:hypothetical protein